MFLPRLSFPSANAYAKAAQAGQLRPGQYVEFEGIKARFAWSNGSHVTTFYGRSGATEGARKYLRDRSGTSAKPAPAGLKYRLLPDGAFVAGDTSTGRTAYAYPTSDHATQAKRQPERVAREMVDRENSFGAWRDAKGGRVACDEFDARQWARLNNPN
jgi:hypothetical protein